MTKAELLRAAALVVSLSALGCNTTSAETENTGEGNPSGQGAYKGDSGSPPQTAGGAENASGSGGASSGGAPSGAASSGGASNSSGGAGGSVGGTDASGAAGNDPDGTAGDNTDGDAGHGGDDSANGGASHGGEDSSGGGGTEAAGGSFGDIDAGAGGRNVGGNGADANNFPQAGDSGVGGTTAGSVELAGCRVTVMLVGGEERVECFEYVGEGAVDAIAEDCVTTIAAEVKEPILDGGCPRNGVTHACQWELENGLTYRTIPNTPDGAAAREALCETTDGTWVML